ncbi:DUF6249 domain-containing protein [Aestuariivivens marinum]|uniref:DUF6249 domain-containing protein n=1 Tax=Aestuariivivens marinum TaxID=2913555 RepID=UPI001F59FFB4|nr:DUF6249 domain-containing protein [Aestuariivivens marinum]
MVEVLIPISFFLLVFGVFYLYLSTRNKERLALIDKGADASIFVSGKKRTLTVWKALFLNLALLLMGIGAGIFISGLLTLFGMDPDISEPGAITFMAGLGLLTGFNMSKNLDKE